MDFAEALKYLLSLGHETLTIKLGLNNTELLLQALQHPESTFPAVQIAGTNGKGSTAAFLDSICRAASIRAGLYTSPHLESITERIKVAGNNISEEDFARHTSQVYETAKSLVESGALVAVPTFFEQITAIALVTFREANVEIALLETGLGGRLDSTTAAKAGVCAITPIAFDHEEYLGHTIAEIASEKAAIIRADSKVVIGRQSAEALAVILKRCDEVGVTPRIDECRTIIEDVSQDGRVQVTFETPQRRLAKVWLGLRGHHQVENAATAIQLAELLAEEGFPISSEAIARGLETSSHPGRLELIDHTPAILLDGAHNPAGAHALRRFLDAFGRRPLTVIFASMRDKRVKEIAELLFPVADELILTEVNNPRTASLETLGELAKQFATAKTAITQNSYDALRVGRERTPPNGMICITGSLYLIGEIRHSLFE